MQSNRLGIDVSVYYDGLYTPCVCKHRLTPAPGYHGDVNATYPVGKIDDESKRLLKATRQSLDAAIALCKPGALIRDLGKVMCVPLSLPALLARCASCAPADWATADEGS